MIRVNESARAFLETQASAVPTALYDAIVAAVDAADPTQALAPADAMRAASERLRRTVLASGCTSRADALPLLVLDALVTYELELRARVTLAQAIIPELDQQAAELVTMLTTPATLEQSAP